MVPNPTKHKAHRSRGGDSITLFLLLEICFLSKVFGGAVMREGRGVAVVEQLQRGIVTM